MGLVSQITYSDGIEGQSQEAKVDIFNLREEAMTTFGEWFADVK